MGAPVQGRGHGVSQQTPSDLMERREQSVSLAAWRAATAAVAVVVVVRASSQFFVRKSPPHDRFLSEFNKV